MAHAGSARCQNKVPGLDYRILLADDTNLIQNQFQITAYPTLVLLDSDGVIVWRGSDAAEADRRHPPQAK